MTPEQKDQLKTKINTFLVGMLSGVIIAAAFTYLFAIPDNSDQWKTEIWKRGGAAWTFDKNGHSEWKWLVELVNDAPRQKQVIAPGSTVKIRSEQL